MIKADLNTLTDYILSKNSYLDKGYYNAYKDDDTKQVFVDKDSGDKYSVFLNDNKGNYFYIRDNGRIKNNASFSQRITDCSSPRLTYQDTLDAYIVLILESKYDPYIVMNNIRNTLSGYSDLNVILKDTETNKETVVSSEMSGAKAEDLKSALQRLKGKTVLRMRMDIIKIVIPNDCILNPCINC